MSHRTVKLRTRLPSTPTKVVRQRWVLRSYNLMDPSAAPANNHVLPPGTPSSSTKAKVRTLDENPFSVPKFFTLNVFQSSTSHSLQVRSALAVMNLLAPQGIQWRIFSVLCALWDPRYRRFLPSTIQPLTVPSQAALMRCLPSGKANNELIFSTRCGRKFVLKRHF